MCIYIHYTSKLRVSFVTPPAGNSKRVLCPVAAVDLHDQCITRIVAWRPHANLSERCGFWVDFYVIILKLDGISWNLMEFPKLFQLSGDILVEKYRCRFYLLQDDCNCRHIYIHMHTWHVYHTSWSKILALVFIMSLERDRGNVQRIVIQMFQKLSPLFLPRYILGIKNWACASLMCCLVTSRSPISPSVASPYSPCHVTQRFHPVASHGSTEAPPGKNCRDSRGIVLETMGVAPNSKNFRQILP